MATTHEEPKAAAAESPQSSPSRAKRTRFVAATEEPNKLPANTVSSAPLETSTTTSSTTPPRFKVLEKVYARDPDGILYVAVIRRVLYGPNYNTQVLLGMNTVEEADALPDVAPPQYHYFCHFNNWSASFDKWVAEEDVYEFENEKNKAYVQRVATEHRKLQSESQNKSLRKRKKRYTIDGASFLEAWRWKLQAINEELGYSVPKVPIPVEMKTENVPAPSEATSTQEATESTKPVKKAVNYWPGSMLVTERDLRKLGLTNERWSQGKDVVVPITLKKDLTKQWEMICQCGMQPTLPSSVSIRQALDHYLASKGVVRVAEDNGSAVLVEGEDKTVPEADERTKDKHDEQWLQMTDGLAQFFDEALPVRLLYKEELPLLDTFKDGEFVDKSYSEVFGCEYLLRLFVNLSEVLGENLGYEDRRLVVAKVNDFIRHMHKNQREFFTQGYFMPKG